MYDKIISIIFIPIGIVIILASPVCGWKIFVWNVPLHAELNIFTFIYFFGWGFVPVFIAGMGLFVGGLRAGKYVDD